MSDGSNAGSTPSGGAVTAPKLYRLTISQVTSVILICFRKTLTKTGTVEELEKFYRQVRAHNMLVGWWGIPVGFIWNAMAMSRNKKALAKLHQLAAGDSASAGVAAAA